MKVLLCGGGNAIHVLACYIGSLGDDYEVSILSLFPGEAQRLKDAMMKDVDDEDGYGIIQCENDLGNVKVYGKININNISNKPEDVVPGSDIVILAIPSFTHPLYLKELHFYLHPGVVLGAMPGQSGFDLCCRHYLGHEFVNSCSLFATETLPWACRIVEYGQTVQVLGTKCEIGIVITPPTNGSKTLDDDLKILQTLIGPKPILKPSNSFLSLTLSNPNTVHPTISYGLYRKYEKDGKILPFHEPPLFYQGVDYETGEMLCQISDEILSIRDELMKLYPNNKLDLSCMLHIRTTLLRYYSNDILDKTNLSRMLQTSRAHRGLIHPMKEITVEEGGSTKKKYIPNFQNRYFTEDLPCGLIVIRGIAELVGNIETPTMDEVIVWCQSKMNKEYLVDGKLCGKDIYETRCPEAYGYTNLHTFLKENHYLIVDHDGDDDGVGVEEDETQLQEMQKVMNDGTLSVKHGFVRQGSSSNSTSGRI